MLKIRKNIKIKYNFSLIYIGRIYNQIVFLYLEFLIMKFLKILD